MTSRSNEIADAVVRTLDQYFRDLDGATLTHRSSWLPRWVTPTGYTTKPSLESPHRTLFTPPLPQLQLVS